MPELQFDKNMLQATLFIEQGNLSQAAQLLEQKLAGSAMELLSVLLTLTQIADKEGDMEAAAQYIRSLKARVAAMQKPWDIGASPLYKHIPVDKSGGYGFSDQMMSACLSELKRDETLAFLKDNPAYMELMERLEPKGV